MARFGDGIAIDADVSAAAVVAAERALVSLDGRQPDLAVVFSCGADAAASATALEIASRRIGSGTTIGATMPGVIGEGRGVETETAVTVWAAVLPDVKIRDFDLAVMPADAGMAVVGMPERHPDDQVAVVLADPWSFPIDGFIEQTNVALPGLDLIGGLASGTAGRGATRLLLDGRVLDRGAVGVLLGGPVGARSMVSQGCRPIGPAMTVTAAEGNVIATLAGQPALHKLEQLISDLPPADQALVTRGLQLGIARDEYADEHEHGDFVIRGIAGTDESGGLVVGDIVPVGRTVRFQVRDAATADTDLVETLQRFARTSSMDTVEGGLLFSCNGRGAAMFDSVDHDPATVRRLLATSGVAGCFAAGEIGPVAGRNYVHAFSASLLAFGSGPGADRGIAS